MSSSLEFLKLMPLTRLTCSEEERDVVTVGLLNVSTHMLIEDDNMSITLREVLVITMTRAAPETHEKHVTIENR